MDWPRAMLAVSGTKSHNIDFAIEVDESLIDESDYPTTRKWTRLVQVGLVWSGLVWTFN